MEGEGDEMRQLTQKETLRDTFTLAANALAKLYQKSTRLEQDARMIGGRDSMAQMFDWVLKRSCESESISAPELLDITRAMYASYGGNAQDLKGEIPLSGSVKQEMSSATQGESVQTGKGQKCQQCGTTSVMVGRKRHRYATDLDLEGDTELSQLFRTKLPGALVVREKSIRTMENTIEKEMEKTEESEAD